MRSVPVNTNKTKPLRFLEAAHDDMMDVPDVVRREFGYGLYVVQGGDMPDNASPFEGAVGGREQEQRKQEGQTMSKHSEEASNMGVVKSSGNVFSDLSLPNADEELAKAELAFAIRQRIKAKGITQSEAAELLGTDQAKVSLLTNGRVSGFTFDRLARFLNALEMNVQIVIEPTANSGRGKTLVKTA